MRGEIRIEGVENPKLSHPRNAGLDLHVEWPEGLGRTGSREVQPDGLGAAGAGWCGRRDDRLQRPPRDAYRVRQRLGAEL